MDTSRELCDFQKLYKQNLRLKNDLNKRVGNMGVLCKHTLIETDRKIKLLENKYRSLNLGTRLRNSLPDVRLASRLTNDAHGSFSSQFISKSVTYSLEFWNKLTNSERYGLDLHREDILLSRDDFKSECNEKFLIEDGCDPYDITDDPRPRSYSVPASSMARRCSVIKLRTGSSNDNKMECLKAQNDANTDHIPHDLYRIAEHRESIASSTGDSTAKNNDTESRKCPKVKESDRLFPDITTSSKTNKECGSTRRSSLQIDLDQSAQQLVTRLRSNTIDVPSAGRHNARNQCPTVGKSRNRLVRSCTDLNISKH